MPNVRAQGQWFFPAQILRVVDGDTLIMRVDLGFRITWDGRVRLAGINTPEVVGIDRAAGLAATGATGAWVEKHTRRALNKEWPFRIQSFKADEYGRYLADVYPDGNDQTLNQHLLESGNAVPYPPKRA